MDLSIVLMSVALVWGVAVVTPGPNFFITLKSAIGRSRRSALFVVLGISTGTFIWAISSFFGITILFRMVPGLYIILKITGGVYISYLGVKFLFSRSGAHMESDDILSDSRKWFQSYKLGLLTNLTNPKTAAFMASIFATTMPSHASHLTGFTVAIMMSAISTCWYTAVACIFSMDRFRNIYRNSVKTWLDRVAGAIFIGFGVKLATGD